MTIDKINELLTLYGNLQYNAGSYSQLSGQVHMEYSNQASQARNRLLEVIIEYGCECAKKEHVT